MKEYCSFKLFILKSSLSYLVFNKNKGFIKYSIEMTFGWDYKVSNKNKKEKQVGPRSPDQNILIFILGLCIMINFKNFSYIKRIYSFEL